MPGKLSTQYNKATRPTRWFLEVTSQLYNFRQKDQQNNGFNKPLNWKWDRKHYLPLTKDMAYQNQMLSTVLNTVALR